MEPLKTRSGEVFDLEADKIEDCMRDAAAVARFHAPGWTPYARLVECDRVTVLRLPLLPGGRAQLGNCHDGMTIVVLDGSASVAGDNWTRKIAPHHMLYVGPHESCEIQAAEDCLLIATMVAKPIDPPESHPFNWGP